MKRIFLVRHGESEANVDRSVGIHKADHAIELTSKGCEQAAEAGFFLNRWLSDNISPQNKGKIRLWHSPYRRANQTAFYVEKECSSWIKDKREHMLLCEQQFGLFDGIPDDKLAELFPRESAHYTKCEKHEGRFWARMPLGESRFDVAKRVHQAFGTFHRDCDQNGIDNIIVVAHGVTIRAFVMMWLHRGVEWFEKEPNPKNCSIRLIEEGVDKGYIFDGPKEPRTLLTPGTQVLVSGMKAMVTEVNARGIRVQAVGKPDNWVFNSQYVEDLAGVELA